VTIIAHLEAREVLDSRGKPTIEVEVLCRDGTSGRAIVPSGASTGAAEAHELRDRDPSRYDGQGVRQAVHNVLAVILPAVVEMDASEQAEIDSRLIELDGTPHKGRLGANAILGVSLAAAHAAANSLGIPLYEHINRVWHSVCGRADAPAMPLPMVNMISGGLHAGGNLDFQDFLISPRGAPDYATGLEWTVRIYRRLGELLRQAGYEGRLVGDEGGFGPRLRSNVEAAEFIVRAIEAAGLSPGEDVGLNLDVAATHFFDGTHYRLAATGNARLTSDEMIGQLESLVNEFPIASIEDGLAEEDWPGWSRLTQRLSGRVVLIGDDLFATNPRRLRQGIDHEAANAILVKPNQVGTLTETLEAMRLADAAGYRRIVSARSGETEDTTIADLAVGVAAEQIKIGSVTRSERLAKYNRLLRIAEEVEH
jgi:enolase